MSTVGYVPPKRKTYTFAEFHQKTGQDHARYQRYLKYVHNVRSAIDTKRAKAWVPPEPNWFAPVAPAVGLQQAKTSALAAFNPAIQQEIKQYAADQTRTGDTITNYTKGLAAFLPTLDTSRGSFNNVQAGIAASNAALAGGLHGQGQQEQSALANYFQQAGTPQDARVYADQAVARGDTAAQGIAAAGQAQYEGGAARQGATADFFAALPQVAAAQGNQTLGSALGALRTAHESRQADLGSQLAKAIQDQYANFQSQELQKETARWTASRYTNADKTKVTVANIGAKSHKTTAQIAAEARRHAADVAARARNNAANIAAQAKAAESARKAGQVDASASGKVGYLVDHNGNPILDAKGKRIPAKAAQKAADLTKVETAARSKASQVAIQLANKYKTILYQPPKEPGAPLAPKPVKKSVRAYTVDQVARLVYGNIVAALSPYHEDAYIRQVALHYARMAFGGGK